MFVRFKCNGCGLISTVDVHEKLIAVDISLWVRQVSNRVASEHQTHAPFCTAKTFDLAIPIDVEQQGRIGKIDESKFNREDNAVFEGEPKEE